MAEEWHSYQEVADALGVQLQAAYKRRRCGSVNTGYGAQPPVSQNTGGGRYFGAPWTLFEVTSDRQTVRSSGKYT